MRKTIIKNILLAVLIIVGLSFYKNSQAVTYFQFDGESGYQYMGYLNPHPGGGYFQHMGGLISGSEGTTPASPCVGGGVDFDTGTYHYTVLSNEAAAQGSIPGSLWSLKTPYPASCPGENFLKDTTVINLGSPVQEYYMRWYQKWTGNWFDATVQQKFFKPCDTNNCNRNPGQFGFMGNGTNVGNVNQFFAMMPNYDGHFDKDGIPRNADVVKVSASKIFESYYPGTTMAYDDDATTTSEFTFAVNTWYCIEVHVKINTYLNSDGLMEVWVNGNKVLGVYNFKWYDGTIYGVTSFEMQHVYYNRDAIDEPTYMDNIVISDHYNGPVNVSDTTPPAAPTGLAVI